MPSERSKIQPFLDTLDMGPPAKSCHKPLQQHFETISYTQERRFLKVFDAQFRVSEKFQKISLLICRK